MKFGGTRAVTRPGKLQTQKTQYVPRSARDVDSFNTVARNTVAGTLPGASPGTPGDAARSASQMRSCDAALKWSAATGQGLKARTRLSASATAFSSQLDFALRICSILAA